jgi:hypothetical protein
MAAKDNAKTEEHASHHAPESTHRDMDRILTTLDQVFSTFRSQLRDETPKHFDGAAKVAVDVFNDIIAGLSFKSIPRAVTIYGQAVSPREIDLIWTDDANNADGYIVKRCQGNHCHNLEEIVRLTSGARSFPDFDVTSRTSYRYQVVAFNSRGETPSNTVEVGTHASRDER